MFFLYKISSNEYSFGLLIRGGNIVEQQISFMSNLLILLSMYEIHNRWK